MGYFSNGSDAMWYEEHACNYCVHMPKTEEGGCPVWDMHFFCQDDKQYTFWLNEFIPRDGAHNDLCKMFRGTDDETHKTVTKAWAGLKKIDWEAYDE